MFVELSLPSTNFQEYKDFRRANDKLESEGILGASVPKPKPSGGRFEVIDWKNKETVFGIDAPTPAGFVLEGESFKVCDELGDRVVSINRRREVKKFISHPWFNYPHDIDRLDDNYLVTSTGLDSILEFDSSGKLIFAWHAVLSGYDTTPTGEKRVIDFDKDHRGTRYATLDRTAHINSAIYMDSSGKNILTTFFHRGELVKINKETGEHSVVLDGLDHPHAIHRGMDGEFIFSETGSNNIHVLDENLSLSKSFDNVHDCEWIQDSIFTPNGTILIGDANKNRVIEVSYPDFVLYEEYLYPDNWKLFKVGWDTEESVGRFLNE